MRFRILGLLPVALSLLAVPAAAQGRGQAPSPIPVRGGIPGPAARISAAELFLSHTGELRLTDQQVVRLAAIARRAADRRAALRARVDSLAPESMRAPMDSAARAARRDRVQALGQRMEQEREQSQADLAAAIAVLTPEQQARAWQLRGAGVAARAQGSPGMMSPRMRPRGMERRMRPEPRRDESGGAAPDRRGPEQRAGRRVPPPMTRPPA